MFAKVQRRPITSDGRSLVTLEPLEAGRELPIVVRPRVASVVLEAWITEGREFVYELLNRHGAVLFRGFAIDDVPRFEAVATAVSPHLVGYTERTAPRRVLSPRVFTSTEHPSDQYIHFHNANSYTYRWPMKIWFCCLVAPSDGGRTPIAHSRRVYELLDPALRVEFERRKVMYLRNFRDGVGLSWQETFQTDDPDEVRAYCARAGIHIELFEGDRLRTRQVRQAVATHPVTHEKVWFNQAHLFHVSSLAPDVQRVLLKTYAEKDLPRNAYYGDGEPIPNAGVEEIVRCYREAEVSFDWQVGDALLLDNMLVAHSRQPYRGERLIAVTFSDLYEPGS